MKLDKIFFISSFLFHVFIILALLFIPHQGVIKKSFLVCGVYSKIPSMAYFKPIRAVKSRRNRGTSLSKQKTSTTTLNGSSELNVSSDRKSKETKKLVKKTVAKSKKPAVKKKKIKKPPVKTAKLKPLKKQALKKKTVEKKILLAKKDEKRKPKKEPEKKILKKEEQVEDVDFDLLGSDNPELRAYQRSIRIEVCRLWHPPLGVSKGTESILQFVVDRSGEVEKFEFIKKSNVLLYDLSISRVANKFKFSNFLWGRKFSIVFRQ